MDHVSKVYADADDPYRVSDPGAIENFGLVEIERARKEKGEVG